MAHLRDVFEAPVPVDGHAQNDEIRRCLKNVSTNVNLISYLCRRS